MCHKNVVRYYTCWIESVKPSLTWFGEESEREDEEEDELSWGFDELLDKG